MRTAGVLAGCLRRRLACAPGRGGETPPETAGGTPAVRSYQPPPPPPPELLLLELLELLLELLLLHDDDDEPELELPELDQLHPEPFDP
jgi:hypothetical protein